MRIVVMGAGGMGGYFGGLLAKAGEDVTLVARGAHLDAMRAHGLAVKSLQAGDFLVRVNATSDPGDIGAVDLVLFCVKTYDLETAAEQIRPLIGGSTIVLPVQNGVDSPDRIAGIIGPHSVIGGVSYVGAKIESPGVIVQRALSGKLIFGELEGGSSTRTEKLLDAFQRCGIQADLHPDIQVAMWEKFIVSCATGGVMALTRLPMGPIVGCPETRDLFLRVMQEVETIARAKGVNISDGTANCLFEYLIANVEPSGRSSLLLDLVAGRRLELDAVNGTVVRYAQELGIATPLNFAVYAALKPYLDGAPSMPQS